MSYKKLNVDKTTDDLIEKCIDEFRSHHKEFDKIHISRNKILYEMARFYLKN